MLAAAMSTPSNTDLSVPRKPSQTASSLLAGEGTLGAMQELLEDASALDGKIGSIPSPQELFAVLNEQLDTVQSLADELHSQGTALCQSEQARCSYNRRLCPQSREKWRPLCSGTCLIDGQPEREHNKFATPMVLENHIHSHL